MNVGDLGRIPMSAQLASTLARAAGYADAQAHIEVTLEHLLLALLEDQDAGNVLRSSRVEAARLAGEVSTHLGRIEERRAPGENAGVAISQDLRRILEAAAAAARQGRRREIDGAIVLAAIVGDGKSTAAHLLRAEGLTFEEAIRALQRATAAQPQPQAPLQQPQPQPRGDTDPRGVETRASADELIATARERIQTRTAPPAAAATPAASTAAGAASASASVPVRPEPSRPLPAETRPPSNFEPQWQPANLPPGPRPAPQPTIVDQPQMPLPPEQRPAPPQQGLQSAAPGSQSQPYARPPEPQPYPAQQAPAPPPGYGGPPPAAPVQIPQPPSQQPPQQARDSLPPPGFDRSFGSPPARTEPAAAEQQRPAPPPAYAPLPPGAPPPAGPQPGFPPPQQVPQQQPRRIEPALPQGGFPPDARGQPSGMPPQQMPLPSGAPPRPQPAAMPPLSAGSPPQHQPREPATAPRTGPPPGPQPHAGHPQSGGGPSQSAPGIAPGQPAPPPQRARTVAPPQNVRVAAGQLVENIPRKMRVGMALVVEARVARAEVKAIAEGLQGGGAVYRHELTVTKAMSVRLRAPDGGFYIENASPETQWIDNVLGLMADDYASWRWTITPTERGRRRLQLLVSARTVGADGLAAETALPDQMIEVKVAVNYAATFARLGGWLVAAVAGGLLARFGEGLIDPLRKLIGF